MRHSSTANRPEPVSIVKTDKAALLSHCRYFLGSSKAPYTLVEFMDFECPPCKSTSAKLAAFVSQYPLKLRLSCLNLPLKMHETARGAANMAEAVGTKGKYWQFHDALMGAGKPTEETIGIEIARLKLNEDSLRIVAKTSGNSTVDADMKLADKLHQTSTPSFLLCTPDNKVFQLHSLSQLEDMLK